MVDFIQVTPENLEQVKLFECSNEYVSFTVVKNGISLASSFPASNTLVGLAVSDDATLLIVTKWSQTGARYFQDILDECYEMLNNNFFEYARDFNQTGYVSITGQQRDRNIIKPEIFEKNIQSVFQIARQRCDNLLLELDVTVPGINIDGFGKAVRNNRLVLNVAARSTGIFIVDTECNAISLSCRLHGQHQSLYIPFEAITHLADNSNGEMLPIYTRAWTTPVQSVEQPEVSKPKRPTFQVIDGGKSK